MKHYGAHQIWCGLTQLSVAWVEEPCYCGKLCSSLPFLDINAVYWDLVYLLYRLKCSFYSCGPRQNINVFGISESEVFGSYYCPTGKRLLLPFTRLALCAVMIYSFQPIYSASRLKIKIFAVFKLSLWMKCSCTCHSTYLKKQKLSFRPKMWSQAKKTNRLYVQVFFREFLTSKKIINKIQKLEFVFLLHIN